jgi:TolB-like protein
MRKSVVYWILPALSVLVLLSGVARAEALRGEGERRNVALLRMELPRGFYSDERVTLANDFLSALHRTGHFDIVDREDMSAILEEQKFQASDLADEEEVVELGGLVGVDLFVACTVKSVEGLYQITARLISVETGRVVQIVSRKSLAKVDFLTAMFNEVAFDLAGEVERKGWVLIETDPSEADVYLFGVEQGSTPLTLRLAPGPYLLSVERRGYVKRKKTLYVEEGRETSWKVEFIKKKRYRLGDYIGGRGFWDRN